MVRIFIYLCWFITVGYWLVNAAKVKQTAERTGVAHRLRYKIFFWIATPLLLGWVRFYPFSEVVIPHSPMSGLVGCAFCLAGVWVAIWARRVLADNWSLDVTLKKNHELVERGPYGFVRHPIYTGLLFMFLGTAIARGGVDGFAGVLFCFLGIWIKLKQEEKLMLRHFPQAYPLYQSRVRALVPYVI